MVSKGKEGKALGRPQENHEQRPANSVMFEDKKLEYWGSRTVEEVGPAVARL